MEVRTLSMYHDDTRWHETLEIPVDLERTTQSPRRGRGMSTSTCNQLMCSHQRFQAVLPLILAQSLSEKSHLILDFHRFPS